MNGYFFTDLDRDQKVEVVMEIAEDDHVQEVIVEAGKKTL